MKFPHKEECSIRQAGNRKELIYFVDGFEHILLSVADEWLDDQIWWMRSRMHESFIDGMYYGRKQKTAEIKAALEEH
jgi:hypothetical protein